MNRSGAVALFDLDRTLLRGSSGALYAKAAYRRGYVHSRDVLRGLLWISMHRVGWLDVAHAYERAGSFFRGLRADVLRQEVAHWFAAEVADQLRPGAGPILAQHRARGERLVLITNSSAYIAEAAARCWGLDDWLANDILVDDAGCITGSVSKPLCYGEGKVHKAQVWAAEHGASLAQSSFYSDSISDLPLLERVARPEVVHPDFALRRLAKRRSWRIHHW